MDSYQDGCAKWSHAKYHIQLDALIVPCIMGMFSCAAISSLTNLLLVVEITAGH